jgi:membrane protein implicated in regulation of membrane protease activity
MLITCPLIKKKNKLKDDAVSDKLVGLIDKEAILEEEIKGIETGLVRVSGIPWRCISKNNKDIPAGTLVKIIEAKGNLLVVKEVGE